MATIQVDAGSPLAAQIQSAVQPKLMELGWAPDENDTTLSEYITMMLVNGKNQQGVQSEIGNELLGMGDEDPTVKDFASWLFDHVQSMVAPKPVQEVPVQQNEHMLMQAVPEMPTADSQMDDAALPGDGAPSGPKAMRDGSRGRGRGGRMLGQMKRQMDRSQEIPDSLRRIKGAASGHTGRINAHANRETPRGNRNQNLTNGVQRMMNGRGGHQQMNPTMQQANMMGQLGPDQQMMFMQMMEMQANMMANMLQNGQMPNVNGQQQGGRSLADRMDKPNRGGRGGARGRGGTQHHNEASQNGDSMDTTDDSGERKPPFEQMCHYNLGCTNPSCKFAHQSPAAPPGTTVDMADTCTHGAACTNKKCTARHPSPAQRASYQKSEVECKFYPNCAMGSACPFKHPDMPPCRNGPDCQVEGCKFSHSKIMCRYNPCLNPACQYRHSDGQKRGKFEDKVWTANGTESHIDEQAAAQPSEATGKSDRFAGIKESENAPEELIVPGQGQQQPEADMVS